ncbi:MAG: hypothetical protein IJR89_03605 [Clostridia bacterium]|nr:hypothetical protein [Clostridia bacterium]
METRSRTKKNLVRLACGLCLLLLTAGAILYQRGAFDFTFLPRAQKKPAVTLPLVTAPSSAAGETEPSADPENNRERFLAALRAASNISGVGSGVLSGGEPLSLSYETLSSLSALGAAVSYADYDSDGTMTLCILDNGVILPKEELAELSALEFYSYAENDTVVPEGRRRIVYTELPAVRLYMGYLLLDDGETQRVCRTETGELLASFSSCELVPAMTRDRQDRPLFYRENDLTRWYYLAADGALAESDYEDETENRGLYFDYAPDYGKSEDGAERYSIWVTVTELVTEAPETTAPPETTEEPVPVDITPEETTALPPEETSAVPPDGAETGADPAPETTGETPETAAPPETGPEPPPETSPETVEETVPAETFLDPNPETQTSPETTAAETTGEPIETGTETGTETGLETGTETETGGETSPETTAETAPEPKILEILYRDEPRMAFGFSPWSLYTSYKYLHIFGYRGGYACVVYPGGRMAYVDRWDRQAIYRSLFYFNENGRLADSFYAEPVLRDERGMGHYYFDRGYVRVRQLDTDGYYHNDDFLVGSYELLLDEKGNRFPIPEGYTLRGYSDGVLLLERGGYYGYYTTEKRWIAQPIYTYAKPFCEGVGILGFDGAIGMIDREGNVLLPFVHSSVSSLSQGAFAAYAPESGWTLYAKTIRPAPPAGEN